MAKHWLFVGALVVGGAIAWAFLDLGEHPEEALAATKEKEHASKVERSSGGTQVEVVKPKRGGLQRVTVQPATLIADKSAELYAKVSGYLKTLQLERDGRPVLGDDSRPIEVDIGTHVNEGDVLAVIDMPELVQEVERDRASLERAKATVFQMQAHLVTAKAQHKAAVSEIRLTEASLEESKGVLKFREIRYDRIEKLVKANAVEMELLDEQEERRHAARSAVLAAEGAVETAIAKAAAAEAAIEQAQADLKEAEAEVEVRRAALKRAEVDLDYATIRSPYTGVITARNFFPGDFIRAAEQGTTLPLLAVEKTDVMRAVVQVPDKDVPYTNVNDDANLEIDALPGVQFQGKVARMSDVEDRDTRTMRTEVDLPNANGRLRTGMYGRISITLESGSDALVIPSPALAGDVINGKGSVFVVRGGKAHKVSVHIGTDNGLLAEVLSGLGPNDDVVAGNASGLSEGVTVTVIDKK